MRVLLTGGGTAGHINPAIAIANYIKEKEKDSEFLFVGTERGLEKKSCAKVRIYRPCARSSGTR